MRVRVAQLVAVRARVVRLVGQALGGPVARVARVVPVLMALPVSALWVRRGLPAVLVVRVVRVVPPGLAGFVVMAGWVVPVVLVGVVVMGR